MKKLLLLMLGLLGGVVLYRKLQAAHAEDDLWIEATSSEPISL